MSNSGGSKELSEEDKEKLLLEAHASINEIVEVPNTGPGLASYGFAEAQAKQIITSINEIRSALHKMGITK